MPVTKQYSRADVKRILQQSEGRLSPVSNQPGHCLEKHVAVSGYQLSDRLRHKELQSDATHPIIMGETGGIRPENEHRDIWKALNPGMTTAQAKAAYRQNIANYVKESGSFLDQQQAAIVGRHLLNSSAGQKALGELDDGAKARVDIMIPLTTLDIIDLDGKKMHHASHGDDITHIAEMRSAFMLVDKLSGDEIHIQTLYPIA